MLCSKLFQITLRKKKKSKRVLGKYSEGIQCLLNEKIKGIEKRERVWGRIVYMSEVSAISICKYQSYVNNPDHVEP